MISLKSAELKRISKVLKKYDLKSTVTQLSGLLTAPNLQANTVRIEIMVHLAVAHCHGPNKPGLTEIDGWLNRQLGATDFAALEDPVEDVFVTNVETPEGNRRIFEGIWESNDYFVQILLDVLDSRGTPEEVRNLLIPALALLRLSDCTAERVDLQRWHIEPSSPKDTVRLPSATHVEKLARAVAFTDNELKALGIKRELLAPFILRNKDKRSLAGESVGHSSLERHPLIDFGSQLVLALPHAISPAIRRFVLFKLGQMGYLQAFAKELANLQARQVEKEGLLELKRETVSIDPPRPDGRVPSMHAWLLKHDLDKYIHVVLLHDRLDLLDAQGLSSFMRYPEELRAGLEAYLCKVAKHCQLLPDFAEGTTLLVLGGLGRAFALSFVDWPDNWRLSSIRISDLLMLAKETDGPITRYLKCIKQKEWAEGEGVNFFNVSGDYNFYCSWLRLKYQLVPRELPIGTGTVFVIGNDMVLPIREEVRKLNDQHVLQTVSGSYASVMRFGRDTYFKSMKDRPIYVSLEHLRAGILAGAVETPRGPSWLVVEQTGGDNQIKRLIYEMWSGFIGLYDRLVFEVEALYPKVPTGAIEIRLNLDKVVIPEEYVESQEGMTISGPKVSVNLSSRTVEVKFPSNFLVHFQQPSNIGERIALYCIAKGLVSLHQDVRCNVEESVLDGLMKKVLSFPGARLIHLLPANPIEYLLTKHSKKSDLSSR